MRQHIDDLLVFLVLACSTAGCGEGDRSAPDATPHVVFGACPEYFAGENVDFSCASVDMPLYPGDPDSEDIPIFVYKGEGHATKKTAQVWFLAGGPGESAASFITPIDQMAAAHPDWDFYSVEHRGVGNSTRLTCPEEDESPMDFAGCAASLRKRWGKDIEAFTTTHAAEDVGALIGALGADAPKVVIYAVSYGTYWANRYLQLFPDQADGVILDSVVVPGVSVFDEFDAHHDTVGLELLSRCDDQPACADRFSSYGGAKHALAALYDDIDAGTLCAPLASVVDRKLLRNLLGAMTEDWFARTLIPPLIYRMHRCDDADAEAVLGLGQAIMGGEPSDDEESKDDAADPSRLDAVSTLGYLVSASEIYAGTPVAELLAEDKTFSFSPDLNDQISGVLSAGNWPLYSDDGTWGKMAATKAPMLLMHGTLDPQTAYDDALSAKKHFNKAHQTFVAMPDSPHGVVLASHTAESLAAVEQGDPAAWQRTCGAELFQAFVDDPEAAVDTSCVKAVERLSFDPASAVNRVISEMYFGSEDPWDGKPGT
jgi:pimeloyl-ACP methyl ester carboxylesterase